MSSYTISNKQLKPNRVFILQKSEMEKRLDPFYYFPELVELEKKVLNKQPKKLRDYVKGIASGATPKRDDEEKYYSDKNSGIPFLRVQNITPFGLDLSDVKFINKETHEGYLKRSQVFEDDLLVTITGRIASASVVPKNFVGNINQHSVVIKTENREISKLLAAFLNSEIGQKLALRRTTGGTRPALDYTALLSIPILNDSRILAITQKVVEKKKQNEASAEKLLASIDDYLLGELGIKLPKPPENTLKNRIFTTSIKIVSSGRFDPFYHQTFFHDIFASIKNCNYPIRQIGKNIFKYEKGVEVGSNEYVSDGVPFVRVADINDFSINYENADKKISQEKFEQLKNNYKPKIGEILYSKDGTIGFCVVVEEEKDYIISGGILRITCNSNLDNYFLKYLLSTNLYKQIANRVSIGAVIKHLTVEEWTRILIPIPPIEKQKEIADHITSIRQQAQQLKDKTNEALKQASEEIEKILIG